MISKCLLGEACRYDGKAKPVECVLDLSHKIPFVSVCPEISGGLSTPRIPSEYNGYVVCNAEGTGVDVAYRLGAKYTTNLAKKNNVACCILKEKSPSCGSEYRYDGTFTSTLVEGEGLTTKALYDEGIAVVSEVVVDDVYKTTESGLTIIFRIPLILDSLAHLYTDDLNTFLQDRLISTAKVVVVNETMDLPNDGAAVVVDLVEDTLPCIYLPELEQVRCSSGSKRNYLLGCLVAQGLGIDSFIQDEMMREHRDSLYAQCRLSVNPMPYREVIALMANLVELLHGILLR